MLKTVNICDRCGATCKWDSLPVRTGHGGFCESVDLCEACIRNVLMEMFTVMSADDAAKWVKVAKTPPKPMRV